MKKVTITEQENEIFSDLISVINSLAPNTKLRIAGGWVRDRLLGQKSNDIDIAVDNMSGKQFAELCAISLHSRGLKCSDVTTIDSNTDANKHLESAILKIRGLEIDFTQLRRESYDCLSRNPKIETGVTPEEDAKRRDLTINSLFYNIHTKEVEDWVGGIKDLEAKIARTPTNPLHTFLEDPLRILRVIRFAARFNLKVDPSIIDAANNRDVQLALQRKVSRERVWAEFYKFMSHENFPYAVELMQKTGLRDLFLSPDHNQLNNVIHRQDKYNNKKWMDGFGDWDADQKSSYHNLNIWNHTIAALKYLSSIKSNHDVAITSIAMLFHDIGKCDACSTQALPDGHHSYKEHEVSSSIMTHQILTDLKAPNDVKNRVVKLVKNHMRLHQLPINSKTGLRRIIRDIGAEDWPNFVAMSKSDSMGKKLIELDPKYDHFDEYAKEYLGSLDGKSEIKPPINGHEIMSLLNIGPGKTVGIVMNSLKEELLSDPDMTKEKAIEFVKSCPIL